MLQSRPITKRASAPKTRTGCLTCKTRRIKCDETRPKCTPCTKSLRACAWKGSKENQSMRVLIPITPRSSSIPELELLIVPSSTLHFRDARDTLYFRVYQEEVGKELAAALRTTPWVESVLRACHTSPSILQTVVALGALNKSMKMLHFAGIGPEAMKLITIDAAASHRAYAIAAYGKAIAGMRTISLDASPTDPTAIRHMLVFGLLVHCMEEYLGSSKTAFQHSQAGYKLLLGWILSNPHMSSNYNGLDSPNTSVLEYPIMQEYNRLDADLALSMYAQPQDIVLKLARNPCSTPTLSSMPAEFQTLDEAQSYEELLVQRTSHLIAELTSAVAVAHQKTHHPQTADFPGSVLDPCHVAFLSKFVPESNAHLASLQAWITSFQPIFAHLSVSNSSHDRVGSAILQTRVIDLMIILRSFFLPSSASTDIFLNQHAEILSLIQRSLKVVPHAQSAVHPIFQTATTFHHPLANLLPTCRDQNIRRQTLEIVHNMSPRDGDVNRRRWVHRILYLVALEEHGRQPDGTIPENKRYRIIWNRAHQNPITKVRTYTVVCGRRVGYPIGETYPAKWRYRFKTFTEEAAHSFVVEDLAGELVGDDDVEGLAREKEREIAKWPRGLEKPNWLKWEELHGALMMKFRHVEGERKRAVQDMIPAAPGWVA